MKKSLPLLLPLLLLPLLAFAALPQGWVFEMTTTELSSGESTTSEMIVVGDRIKMSMAGRDEAPDGDVNFLGDVGEIGEMVYNDDERRTFIRMNEEMLEQLSSQLGDVEAQMAEAMAGLPEAQRNAIMERMRSGGMPGMPGMPKPPVVEMRATSDRDTKAGYPCVKYELVMDGVVTQEMWMTEWSNIEGARAAMPAFEKFMNFMTVLREKMPGRGMFGAQDAMAGMDFRERFAVVTVELQDGRPVRETTLTGISQREIALSDIGPKEGYEEQSMGPGGR